MAAEIITLRAIALKQRTARMFAFSLTCRDHNATSYSTETLRSVANAEFSVACRDHNATSYSTETRRVKSDCIAIAMQRS